MGFFSSQRMRHASKNQDMKVVVKQKKLFVQATRYWCLCFYLLCHTNSMLRSKIIPYQHVFTYRSVIPFCMVFGACVWLFKYLVRMRFGSNQLASWPGKRVRQPGKPCKDREISLVLHPLSRLTYVIYRFIFSVFPLSLMLNPLVMSGTLLKSCQCLISIPINR